MVGKEFKKLIAYAASLDPAERQLRIMSYGEADMISPRRKTAAVAFAMEELRCQSIDEYPNETAVVPALDTLGKCNVGYGSRLRAGRYVTAIQRRLKEKFLETGEKRFQTTARKIDDAFTENRFSYPAGIDLEQDIVW